MFSTTSMQSINAVRFDERGGRPLSSVPAKSPATGFRQVLSPMLTNSRDSLWGSPLLMQSPQLQNELGRLERLENEVAVAQEEERQKHTKEKNARILFLEQQTKGFEAELSALRDQLAKAANAASLTGDIDVDTLTFERDMYREQEQAAQEQLRSLQIVLAQRNTEHPAPAQVEQERNAARTQRDQLKRQYNDMRAERDDALERLKAATKRVGELESNQWAFEGQLNAERKRVAALDNEKAQMLAHIHQLSQQPTAPHVQQKHQEEMTDVLRRHGEEMAAVQEKRDHYEKRYQSTRTKLEHNRSHAEGMKSQAQMVLKQYNELRVSHRQLKMSHEQLGQECNRLREHMAQGQQPPTQQELPADPQQQARPAQFNQANYQLPEHQAEHQAQLEQAYHELQARQFTLEKENEQLQADKQALEAEVTAYTWLDTDANIASLDPSVWDAFAPGPSNDDAFFHPDPTVFNPTVFAFSADDVTAPATLA